VNLINFKLLGLLLPLILAACAQLPAKVDSGKREGSAEQTKISQTDLPKQELTAPMLFDFLLAEVALQRGYPEIALKNYLKITQAAQDPRFAQRATEIALNLREPFAAEKAVSLWTQLDPGSLNANQAAAALLVNMGRLDEARPHLEMLLASDDSAVDDAFMQLNKLLAIHTDKVASLKLVQQLAEPYPDLPEAHFAVSQAAWLAEYYEIALNAMKQALTLRPDWEIAAVYQGQILRRMHYADVAAYYKDFLDEYPKANEVRAAYVRMLIAEQDYDSARAQLQQLLVENPDNADIALTIGLLSMELRDFDLTETHFKKALGLGYKDPSSIHFYLAQIYEETQRSDLAIASYRKVKTGDRFIPAQIRYAALLAEKGELNAARQHLQQLPAVNDQQMAHLILAEAQLLRQLGEHQQVYDLLDDGLKKLPDFPELLYDRALAADKIGKFDILERDLRRLIQLRPESAHAYNALGYSLAERGDRLPEALKLIKKAVALSPDDAYIMDSLGWVYYRMGNIQEGLNYLNLAFAARPDPEIAAHLGEVLWVKGAKEDAKKIWQSVLRDNPDNEVLLQTMERFLSQ
jgi:tetratricopeptide (TPR) repeat protein